MSVAQGLHSYCKRSSDYETLKEILNQLMYSNDEDKYKVLEERRLDLTNYTPLHAAVNYQNHKTVQLLLMHGADINSKTSSGYTPLHLASSNNDLDCVQLLLQYPDIDLNAEDSYGKTAYRTAKVDGNEDVAKCIKSEEIKQAARKKKNSKALEEMTQNLDGSDITSTCLNDAVQAAVAEGHLEAVKILLKVASKKSELLKSIKPECGIVLCLDRGFYDILTLLMVCFFAKKGLVILIKDLLGQTVTDFANIQEQIGAASYLSSRDIARSVLENKRLDLAAAISFAETYHHYDAVHTLMCYNCLRGPTTSPTCNWRRLGLRHLKSSLIVEYEFMKKLSCIDLCENNLRTVPEELFQLENLNTLMLCHNNLKELPSNLPRVTPTLRSLRLSDNALITLPKCFADTKLIELCLDKNKFRTIPQCVLEITSLKTLNIKENPDITEIPDALGKLKCLTTFMFDEAKIFEPPKIEEHNENAQQLVRWLWNRLRSTKTYSTVRLMVTGWQGRGKTTLIHRLEYDNNFNENVATEGVQISQLKKHKSLLSRTDSSNITFQVWDFAGHEDYYVTHLCFMSAVGLYLLVWNLTEGKTGISNLGPWLDTIAARQEPRMIGVQSVPATVIVVGTHLDEIRKHYDKYAARYVETMRRNIRDMINTKFGDQIILADVVEVSCAHGSNNEGVEELREKIFKQGKELVKVVNEREIKLLDERVPHSFFALVDRIRELRGEVIPKGELPVLSTQRFREVIQEVSRSDSTDVEHPDDFEEALRFLKERGIVLHFDDPNGNLRDLFFIDPIWLCRLMSRVITFSTSSKNFVGPDGILEISKLQRLENEKQFPAKYHQQYICLLNRLQVVFSLDDQFLLVPSRLPIDKPGNISISNPIRRFVYLTRLPHGFFSRLSARLMHFLPRLIEEIDSAIANAPTDCNQACTSRAVKETLPLSDTARSENPRSNHFLTEREICRKMEPTNERLVYKLLQNGQLRCWRTGMHFKQDNLAFLLELTTSCGRHSLEIQMCSSAAGRHALCFIVDHIDSLVDDWFSGLRVQHKILCPECPKLDFKPHEFTFEECQELLTKVDEIKCPHHGDLPVTVHDMAPDLLFHDVSPELLLHTNELSYDADCEFSLLDHGAFGRVYRGTCRDKSAAIKVFSSYLNSSYEVYRELRKEVNVLRRVSHHRNLVTMLGFSLSPPCLVLELAEQRSLADNLFDNTLIPRLVLFMIAYEVADAVSVLHSLGIIHRDLKPRNILLYSLSEKDEVHVKLTDFGTANFAGPCGLKSERGPVAICAPEMLAFADQVEYGTKVDVYSFGILLYNLITRQPAFTKCNKIEVRQKVLSGKRPVWLDVVTATHSLVSMTQLMCACWQQKPSERPTALETRDQLGKPIFQLLMRKLAFPITIKFECMTMVPSNHQMWVAIKENDASFIVVISLDSLHDEHIIEVKGDHVTIRQMCLVENQVLVNLHRLGAGHAAEFRFYCTSNYTMKSSIPMLLPVLDMSSVQQSILVAHGSQGCCFYGKRDDIVDDCTIVLDDVKILTKRPVTAVASTVDSLWLLSFDTLLIFRLPLMNGSDGLPMKAVFPVSNTVDNEVKPIVNGVREMSIADYDTPNSSDDAMSENNTSQHEKLSSCSANTEETSREASTTLPKVSSCCLSRTNDKKDDPQFCTGICESYDREYDQAKIKTSSDRKFVWILRRNILTRWRVHDQSKTTLFNLPDLSVTNSVMYGNISCFEPAFETVWVGTSKGFLLIFSAASGAILAAFKPYMKAVVSLDLCTFMNTPVIVSCGTKLNTSAFSVQDFNDPVFQLSLNKTEVLRSGLHGRVKRSSKLKVKKTRSQNVSQEHRANEGHWIESSTETNHVMLMWHVVSEINLKKLKG